MIRTLKDVEDEEGVAEEKADELVPSLDSLEALDSEKALEKFDDSAPLSLSNKG